MAQNEVEDVDVPVCEIERGKEEAGRRDAATAFNGLNEQ